RDRVHTCIEVALDYAHAGLLDEALDLLGQAPRTDPMVLYYAGWIELQRGKIDRARSAFRAAAAMSPDCCFPHRIECVGALEAAIAQEPGDARARYYLGNFWYSRQRHAEAIAAWEASRDLDPGFATVH